MRTIQIFRILSVPCSVGLRTLDGWVLALPLERRFTNAFDTELNVHLLMCKATFD